MINENEQLEIIPSENHQQIVNDEINNHRITEMEMKDNSEKLKIDNESRKMSINIGENSPDKNGHTETIHLNLIDKVHDASQIPKAEERSSIFNSKFLVNKSDLENFYEQNPFLHFNNIYDDHHQIHEEMNNLIYDEKLDFPFKSSLKVHAPNERSTPEKVIKRKKNMNNLKKEVDNDITPPNFEKAPILESPMKEEEQPRFPYKPINAEKEEKMEKFLEQLSRTISNKSSAKKVIKINEREFEAQNTHVNTLQNGFTKEFFHSTSHSDVIQSSLEYNNHLIKQLMANKKNLNKSEFEHSLIILWENLKKLSRNAETHIKFFPLRNETKYNDLYSEFLKNVDSLDNNEDNMYNEIDGEAGSILGDRLKRKRNRADSLPHTYDFTIIVDKSILKEH